VTKPQEKGLQGMWLPRDQEAQYEHRGRSTLHAAGGKKSLTLQKNATGHQRVPRAREKQKDIYTPVLKLGKDSTETVKVPCSYSYQQILLVGSTNAKESLVRTSWRIR